MGSVFQGYTLHTAERIDFEGDISYFFTQSLALEFAVNAPTQQNVSLSPVGKLGNITVLMPTLMAQYHFANKKSPVVPYVGLGVAWGHLQNQDFSQVGSVVNMTKDTTGLAYEIGLDYNLSGGFSINFDYKHVQMIPNLKDSSGNILTDANMSPSIFSIGVGFRF
jgi:outer membrane protein